MVEILVGAALVVLGAVLGYGAQALGKRQDITLQARLILTETYRFLFGDTEWMALLGQLHKLRIYLELAKVPAQLTDQIEAKAKECWRESRKDAEEHFDPEIGFALSMTCAEQYRELERAVNESLGKRLVLRRR